jgi:pimeloyl-ACP methyl ester carboxylesterase
MQVSSEPGRDPESHTADASPVQRSGLRAFCTTTTLTGGLTELAWIGAHSLLYPLGARTERLRPDLSLRPGVQPASVRALWSADPLAGRTPVLLVHGFIDNRSVFTLMRRGMRRRGFTSVSTWGYTPWLDDVRRAATDLGRHIEQLCRATGHESVHVVGHSLGGLIARYHVQLQGGDERVAELVTLGSPHGGTLWAHLGPTPLTRSLKPGSPLLRELAAPAAGCRTRVTAVYSDLDQVIVPTAAGRCDHPDLQARNVLVRGVGHMSLPIHRGVVDEVANTLAGAPRAVPAPAPAHAA